MRSIIGGIGLIAALSITPVFADGSQTDLQVGQLLNLLRQAMPPAVKAPGPGAGRTGIFRFKITFTSRSKITTFSNPLRCGVQATHFTGSPDFLSYSAARDIPLNFPSQPPDTEHCNIDLPFDWPIVDEAGNVNLLVTLQTDHTAANTAGAKNMFNALPVPPIAMPADGEVTSIVQSFNLP